ncbi:glycosyltransferase family 1 protein [Sesbania bispinosa]|nr:glycosyltransferase family 1 protein [Sesbania bispinosa]
MRKLIGITCLEVSGLPWGIEMQNFSINHPWSEAGRTRLKLSNQQMVPGHMILNN